MSIRLSGSLLCSGLLLFAVSSVSAAPAPQPIVGGCNTPKMKFIVSRNGFSTGSMIFANIPEAAVSFTQGGTRPGCVVVRFSAQSYAGANNTLHVRAFLDNKTAGLPASVQYAAEQNVISDAHAYDFVFPSVAPGVHVLRMQFRSDDGGSVKVGATNTIVQYVP
jgi:hypothetical protein